MFQFVLSCRANTLFTNLLLYRTFVYSSMIFYKLLAVSPEIVPAPESHRSVALLISSQSRITFGRSFSCQGAREKNIPQGVTFKTPIFVRFFKTFFKKLKVCSVAQKRPSLGRHFESLKKRLFLKFFYFR